MSEEAKLKPTVVEKIFTNCLFNDGEVTDKAIVIEGITNKFYLNPDRLSENETQIEILCDELPDSFKEEGGGGMSFLNACMDKEDKQWTGEHRVMECLFVLGMAIGKVKLLLPRDIWASLPGGMPYYSVLTKEGRK